MVTKQLSTTKEHMVVCGFNPRKKKDKLLYAEQLEAGEVFEPRQLRGTKKDKSTGFLWSRKEEYIAKHKYGIKFPFVAAVLSGQAEDVGYCLLDFSKGVPGFSRYLIPINGDGTAYVSVYAPEKGVKKIVKAVPVDVGFPMVFA